MLTGLIDLKTEFSCIMLKLPVRQPVQMRTQHLNIPMFKKIIEYGAYTDQQIFNVDETGGCWP
jgi:hypothetical protein